MYGWFKDNKNVYIILEYATDGDLYHEIFRNE